MRRRFNRPGPRRASFRRRRRVVWLPGQGASASGVVIPTGAVGSAQSYVYPLEDPNNPFVPQASRFAAIEDEVTYMRILGELRMGLYWEGDPTPPASLFDYVVSYGLMIVEGEYDTSGNWGIPSGDIPNASNSIKPQDAARPWLYRRQAVLSLPRYSSPSGIGDRDRNTSTDSIGPEFSHIDIKPRRKAKFTEKLILCATVETNDPDPICNVVINYNLRILTAKWG